MSGIPEGQSKKKEWVKALSLLFFASWDIVIFTFVGVLIGYLAWKKAGMPYWLVGVTGTLGFSVGIYSIMKWVERSK